MKRKKICFLPLPVEYNSAGGRIIREFLCASPFCMEKFRTQHTGTFTKFPPFGRRYNMPAYGCWIPALNKNLQNQGIKKNLLDSISEQFSTTGWLFPHYPISPSSKKVYAEKKAFSLDMPHCRNKISSGCCTWFKRIILCCHHLCKDYCEVHRLVTVCIPFPIQIINNPYVPS